MSSLHLTNLPEPKKNQVQRPSQDVTDHPNEPPIFISSTLF